MSSDHLIFDLDGTISDPKIGIARSINFALESHDFHTKDHDEIGRLIGIPLDQMYSKLIGVTETTLISSLIMKYRERYLDVGYSENTLYEGILTLLKFFHSETRFRLGICTSKRKETATKILEMFELAQLFEFISGGDIGVEKHQQLGQLLHKNMISQASLMIGDRFIDIRGAKRNKLGSGAVLWGYGSMVELQQELPDYVFMNPSEIKVLAE